MFQSGFHKLSFFFMVAGAVIWFVVIRDWSNVVVAVIGCVPASFLTFMLGSMVTGTLRQTLPDSFATWLSLLGGVALIVWAFISFDGNGRYLIGLAGGALLVGGAGLLQLRINSMRYRVAMGEGGEGDAEFLADLDRAAQR